MKRIIAAATLFFLLGKTTHSQAPKFQDIIGTWNVVGEQGTGASLQIIDSNTIILTYMGEKKNITNYNIDFSKTPCWFDFSAKDSSSVLHVKSLMQKVGDDVLKWQLFVEEDRAPYFTSNKGELLYLKKANPATGGVIAAAVH